ncbi:MAG: ABC transporter permease [Chloroflexi bacterium]|nr:MAG: ABC transporter permease [Chloroflexota bacterium]
MTVAGDVRAFLAAARKELQIIRRYPLNYVGGLFWGALLPAVYVLMGQAYSGGSDPRAMRAFAERAGTTEFAGFVFIGYAMYMWLSSVLWGPGTSLRREQIQGSLEATMLTPVSRLILLFGPGMSAIPSMLFTFVVTFVTLWIMFGFVPPLGSLFPVVIIVLVAVPAMYAIGTLFAAGVLRYGEIGPVVQIVRGTFVLACGITFPVAMLPAWAQTGASVLPPTYIVSDIRAAILQSVALPGLVGDLAVTIGLTALIAALAILLFGYLERSARRSGMLGRY